MPSCDWMEELGVLLSAEAWADRMRKNFFSHVTVKGECWIWEGAVLRGYPVFKLNDRVTTAGKVGRWLYDSGGKPKKNAGKPVENTQFRARCGKALCVSPTHQVERKFKKKLSKVDPRLLEEMSREESWLRSNSDSKKKLSDDDALNIRKDPRHMGDIAEEYGVSLSTIFRIKNGSFCYPAYGEVNVNLPGGRPVLDQKKYDGLREDLNSGLMTMKEAASKNDVSYTTAFRVKHGIYCKEGKNEAQEPDPRLVGFLGGKPVFSTYAKRFERRRKEKPAEAAELKSPLVARKVLHPDNCAIMTKTADGVPAGRCWIYLGAGDVCSRHGVVRAAQARHRETGELTPEEEA